MSLFASSSSAVGGRPIGAYRGSGPIAPYVTPTPSARAARAAVVVLFVEINTRPADGEAGRGGAAGAV